MLRKFLGVTILIFTLFLTLFSKKVESLSKLSDFYQKNEIVIEKQDYIDFYIEFTFKEINSTHWFVNFTFNTSFLNDVKDVFNKPCDHRDWSAFQQKYFQSYSKDKVCNDIKNLTNYPFQSLTQNIKIQKITFDLNNGFASFYLIFPSGFKAGEKVKFGFDSTIIRTELPFKERFYLHSEKELNYYKWSPEEPDNFTLLNFSVNKGINYLAGWITPALRINETSFFAPHNWFAEIYVHNSSSSEGNFFFKIFKYNGSEEEFFTSSYSEFLNSSNFCFLNEEGSFGCNEFLGLAWQTKDFITRNFKEGERVLVKLYFNATKEGSLSIAIDSNFTPSLIFDPVETRYLRSDTHTINGLTAYRLLTSNSATSSSIAITGILPIYIKIYKRSSDGTETEIGNFAWYRESGENIIGWNCPQTALSPTDAIVVRFFSSDNTTILRTWITEQLGATQLNSAQWVFRLYVVYSERTGAYYFYHGSSTHPSRIENFIWSVDTEAPRYSLNSTNSTLAGTFVSHNLFWQDNVGLNQAIFYFDNCTGNLQQVTSMSLSGTSAWSNFTVKINDTVGCIIKWCVNASDTNNNWNDTSCLNPFSYITTSAAYLEVNLASPPLEYTISQNYTFWVNASVVCKNGNCGIVSGIVRYNASSLYPDTPINTTQGVEPFYIVDSWNNSFNAGITNQISCGSLNQDQACNLSWLVNATGPANTFWKIGVLFSSSQTPENHTENSTIHIVECLEDISLSWDSIDFGQLIPDTPASFNPAPGNVNKFYNITNKGTCTLNIWIKGTDLEGANSVIKVGNLSWSNYSSEYNLNWVYPMSYSYSLLFQNLMPNFNSTTYFWLAVPPVYPGIYKGFITICGNYSTKVCGD